MKKYEYDTIKVEATGWLSGGGIDDDELRGKLNFKGHQGWELVSCFTTNEGYGRTKFIVAVLKREIE